MLNDDLAVACTFGSTERVRALLAAQPEASKRAPYAEDCPSLLHHAASAGHAEVVALLLEEREHMPDACLVAILARQMIRGHLISVGRIKLGAVCHGREKLYAIDMTLARRMMQSSLPVLVHCGTICTRLDRKSVV